MVEHLFLDGAGCVPDGVSVHYLSVAAQAVASPMGVNPFNPSQKWLGFFYDSFLMHVALDV
jgi:hypothetical protein